MHFYPRSRHRVRHLSFLTSSLFDSVITIYRLSMKKIHLYRSPGALLAECLRFRSRAPQNERFHRESTSLYDFY